MWVKEIKKVGDENSTLFWIDPWLDGLPLKGSFRRLYELADNKLATVEDMFSMGWGWMVRRGSGVSSCSLGRKSWWGRVLGN